MGIKNNAAILCMYFVFYSIFFLFVMNFILLWVSALFWSWEYNVIYNICLVLLHFSFGCPHSFGYSVDRNAV